MINLRTTLRIIGRAVRRPGTLAALVVVWTLFFVLSAHVDENTGLIMGSGFLSVVIIRDSEERAIRRKQRDEERD